MQREVDGDGFVGARELDLDVIEGAGVGEALCSGLEVGGGEVLAGVKAGGLLEGGLLSGWGAGEGDFADRVLGEGGGGGGRGEKYRQEEQTCWSHGDQGRGVVREGQGKSEEATQPATPQRLVAASRDRVGAGQLSSSMLLAPYLRYQGLAASRALLTFWIFSTPVVSSHCLKASGPCLA